MTFPWILVRGREAIKTCTAPDVHVATLILGPDADKGEWVCSRSSHRVGFPKALPDEKCRSCGVRERRNGYDRCQMCQNARRQERAGAVASGEGRTHGGRRAGAGGPRPVKPGDKRLADKSDAHKAKIAAAMKASWQGRDKARQANIQRGVTHRLAKHTQGA